MQQYLPFTVLKQEEYTECSRVFFSCNSTYRLRYWNEYPRILLRQNIYLLQQYLPFTVLKLHLPNQPYLYQTEVATVLTVYGIETRMLIEKYFPDQGLLQQYLPFTVLKQYRWWWLSSAISCCNSTYRLRYWNELILLDADDAHDLGCNSTYRLRYWNHFENQFCLF